MTSKDVALSLREMADKLPKQPVHLGLLQQALRGGAADIEQLRAQVERLQRELWVIAECIFQNVSSDDAKHWARGIKVSLQSGDAAPRVTVETNSVHPGTRCACVECQNRFPSSTPQEVYRRLVPEEPTPEQREQYVRAMAVGPSYTLFQHLNNTVHKESPIWREYRELVERAAANGEASQS